MSRRSPMISPYRRDWLEALARAQSVNAIPSAFPLPARVSRFAAVKVERAERTRKARALEEMES